MRRFPIHIAAVLTLLLPLLPAFAAATTSVRLEVDKHILSLGEVLQVTVEVTVDGQGGYEEYLPPTMADFRVGGSALTSQNIEVVNWRVRRHETYVYQAVPLKEGRLTVGPAAVRVGGRTVRSERIVVEVKRGALPQQPGPTGSTPRRPAGARGSTFIGVNASSTKVYVGQQVVAVWHLYTQGDVLGYQPVRQPSTDQFWAEDLRSPRRLSFERQVIDNRVFYAAVVLRKALFPQRPGKLVVGPLSSRVRTMDRFVSAPTETASEPLELEVLPLPAAGRPAGFSDQNVGSYQIASSVDRRQVKAGEAVQLKLVIRGHGNLRQLSPPKVPPITGVKVYEPKVQDRLQFEDAVSGEKIVEVLLLPTRGGQFEIPALHLETFDPVAGRYKRLSTDPVTIGVTGQLPAGKLAALGDGKQNVLGLDIRPPRQPAALVDRPSVGAVGALRWVLLALPLSLFLLVAGTERLRVRLSRQTARSRSRAAAKKVRRHLARAQEGLKHGDAGAMYGGLTDALQAQLSVQLGLRVEGLTHEQLRARMASHGLSAELSDAVIVELERCDMGRFAGAGGGGAEDAVLRVRDLVGRVARARGA